MKYCSNNNKNLVISWKRRWEKFNGRNNGDILYLTEKATCTDCLTLTFFPFSHVAIPVHEFRLREIPAGTYCRHDATLRYCQCVIASIKIIIFRSHNAVNIHQTTITLNPAHLPLFRAFPFAASFLSPPPQAIDGNSSSDLLGLEKWWKKNNLFGV